MTIQTGLIRNASGQNPAWVIRNYAAIIWAITKHFTPTLSDLKNLTENKMCRDTFPTRPCCSFSKAIRSPFSEGKNEGESFLLRINTLVHIPSFYTAYISTWHYKLLWDGSVCYWLTAQVKSFLCASTQLCSDPSGILTTLCQTNTNPIAQEFLVYQQASSPLSRAQTPPAWDCTVLQHTPFTSLLQAPELGCGLAAIPNLHVWKD